MAKDIQSTGREHARQQSSEMAHAAAASTQHGDGPGAQRGFAGHQSGWQGPGESHEAARGAVAAGRPLMPTTESYYGAFGASPFSMLRRITDDMDRLFESFGFGRPALSSDVVRAALPTYTGESAWGLWSPRIDVRERDGRLSIAVDLPGVRKDEVNVEITPEAVTIQGERRQEWTSDERGYYRRERSYGNFQRTIALPEGANIDSAAASFRDGVLHIDIQVPQRPMQGRKLEIKEASRSEAPQQGASGGAQQQR
jgi:HSP20 family protein